MPCYVNVINARNFTVENMHIYSAQGHKLLKPYKSWPKIDCLKRYEMLRLVDFASEGNKRRIFVCNFVIVSLIYWSSNFINYILSVYKSFYDAFIET